MNALVRISVLTGLLAVAACSDFSPADYEYDPTKEGATTGNTILGKGGLSLLGGSDKNDDGGALGVNSFLWRATLDTIAFMPVSTADPFGGVVLTDWHSTPEAPNERFKLNVYILGRTLRADGIRVAVFSQRQDTAGQWRDSIVPDNTGVRIEDAILTRARQLRRETLGTKK
ncbi:MAG: DUF3576 domain-containing protein [Rhodospirillaceae bacterium]